jgi:hypothetical protein
MMCLNVVIDPRWAGTKQKQAAAAIYCLHDMATDSIRSLSCYMPAVRAQSAIRMTLPVDLLVKRNDTYTDACDIKDTQVRCAVCPDTHAPEPVWTAADVRTRHLNEVQHTINL